MRNTGYNTRQKEKILEYIKQPQVEQFTAKDISDYLDENNAHIGLATIYRSLESLAAAGTVRKYSIDGSSSSYFQFIGDATECCKHYHFKCEKCGRLIHFQCDELKGISNHLSIEHGFEIDMLRTTFYGICDECSNRGNGGHCEKHLHQQ